MESLVMRPPPDSSNNNISETVVTEGGHIAETVMTVTTLDDQLAVFASAAALLKPGRMPQAEVLVPQLRRVPPDKAGRQVGARPPAGLRTSKHNKQIHQLCAAEAGTTSSSVSTRNGGSFARLPPAPTTLCYLRLSASRWPPSLPAAGLWLCDESFACYLRWEPAW
jgi:hypothetical protein